MLKKKVKYENADGESVEEVLHFNLTQAEIIDLDMSLPDGFEQTIKKAAATDDRRAIVNLFKEIIKMAYGIRVGSQFKKSAEISEDFTHTEAYSALFVELFTNADSAAEFFNALVPKVTPINPPPAG